MSSVKDEQTKKIPKQTWSSVSQVHNFLIMMLEISQKEQRHLKLIYKSDCDHVIQRVETRCSHCLAAWPTTFIAFVPFLVSAQYLLSTSETHR